ncbi:hypothetical protein AVEN_83948-1 [Araneus ventricosus]|uniref:DDE-1 domain-containing protein n=1 Tax=Araneus ventricosus TaxID=182803 RepID=A0A4Y2BR16_ARAVE|nr:hypothetical protein AVEN_83948-1 [Araneus ventricosus]
MFIFPRKRENTIHIDGVPPGSFAQYHPSGWMQREILVYWFQTFIQFSKPSNGKPVLLILDFHATHTKSLDLINFAREKNVTLLCLPPHCSHRMQPLDVTFMTSLSIYYQQEVSQWLATHPGRAVTIQQVAKLYGAAFLKAAGMQTAGCSSGRNHHSGREANPILQTQRKPEILAKHRPLLQPKNAEPLQNEHCSSKNLEPQVLETDNLATSSAFAISPKDIIPPPQAASKKTEVNDKRKGETVILTSSPYKIELEYQVEEKKKEHEKYAIKEEKIVLW